MTKSYFERREIPNSFALKKASPKLNDEAGVAMGTAVLLWFSIVQGHSINFKTPAKETCCCLSTINRSFDQQP